MDRTFDLPGLLTATLLLTATAGCGPGGGGEADTGVDAGPQFDEQACSSFVVPHRFGFRWEKLNHRFSRWNVAYDTPSDNPCDAQNLETAIVGGAFSMGDQKTDNPALHYGFRRQSADQPNAVGAARRSVDVTLEGDGLVEQSKTFDRSDLNLEHYDRVVPLIEGFGFTTDVDKPDDYPDDYDPAHGYTLRRFGASVATAELTDESLRIDYGVRLTPGTAPDRDPHNRAVPHARIEARLDVLLIGVDDRPVQTGGVDYELAYEVPEAAMEDDFPPASDEQQRVSLEGEPGAGEGIWGLQSFDFALSTDLTCQGDLDCPEGETCNSSDQTCTEKRGKPGFYIREFTVDATLDGYDAETGEADFLLNGYASNATQLIGFWAMTSRFTGQMAWIQTGDASPSHRGERTIEEAEKTFPLSELQKAEE
jgi:hypothetical protein